MLCFFNEISQKIWEGTLRDLVQTSLPLIVQGFVSQPTPAKIMSFPSDPFLFCAN